ncbi:hydroxyacid dehydrogenase [Cerasicoccus maritimus]|uniref:hydroxyacid dehydrogenase n=1 Tax=Cerasicoccus maritimus TaxID=490089 RepID=UPI002852D61B|nr:hydroxyacid dehydrogenase [Cerasicoccus maritimus]
MSKLPQSAYILSSVSLRRIYSEQTQRRIGKLTRPLGRIITAENWREHTDELATVECILSGWGMPLMDDYFLDAMPQLKHVFYGAGSIRGFYTEAARSRSIGVSSSWRANAIPTAEFAYAAILLSLKKYWRAQQRTEMSHAWQKPPEAAGIFRSTVGIVSLGAVGRKVASFLTHGHSLNVLAYDPFISQESANAIGAHGVSLEELFASSDVVSLHAPSLPETEGMIDNTLLASMKPHATLINTARGALIDEATLISFLQERTDIDAVLDVTSPEPCPADSLLWKLPNAFITPHIAGSLNTECYRLGEYMADELERYLEGLDLEHEVTEEVLLTMA